MPFTLLFSQRKVCVVITVVSLSNKVWISLTLAFTST